jgi:DNA polymerase III subunit beta
MIQTEAMPGTGVKISCSRDELVSRLAVVTRAVSTRAAVQILSGVLIQVADSRVTLAATDMELSLRTSLDGDVEGEGSIVVPGRLLNELSRLLPDDDVEIAHGSDDGVVHIRCGPASYTLNTYSPEDFPRLPEADAAELFAVDRAVLLETAARVSRSASRDESRPVLTGVLVRFEGGKLVMAATDSYRLSVKETQLEGESPELEAIVPARALAELARIAQGADELRLGIRDNHVVFATDDAWLTTRRIDGQFPNYRQLIPETFEHELSLPRGELLDVVRRTAVLAQRNSPLRLRFSEGELVVSAQTQDVGEARESLPVEFSGDPLEMGFNADFLRDGVESVDDERLQLRLISPLRPGLIRSPQGDFSYLIMPIRLAG